MIEFATRPGEVRHFVHKRIFGGIKGAFTGGLTGALGGFLVPGGGSRTRRPFPSITRVPRPAPVLRGPRPRSVVPGRGLRSLGQRIIPGGATGLVVAGAPTGDGCPQGFHPNKSDYMTTAGFVAKHSKCVRNRRRNLSNGRANTRALRRMAAWDKQERKLGKTMKAIARGR